MTRTAASLPFLFALGCTVGPNFVGETAETGDSVGAGEGTDGGDTLADDGGDAPTQDGGESTGASGCALDCPPGHAWTVAFERRPVGASFDADGRVRVFLNDPWDDGDQTDAQTYDFDGQALGELLPVGLPANGYVIDMTRRDAFLALLYTDAVAQWDTYHVALVPTDLGGPAWSTEYAPGSGDLADFTDVAISPDGTVRVTGQVVLGGESRMFVHAYTSAGELAWTWLDEPAQWYHRPVFIGRPQTDAVTVWSDEPDSHEDSSPAQIVRIDAAGSELARTVIEMPGTRLVDPVRATDGWTVAGAWSEDGGIWLAHIDESLVLGPPIDDATVPHDTQVFGSRLVPRDGGVLLLAVHWAGSPDELEVRSYDDEGLLEDVVAIPRPIPNSQGPYMELTDAMIAPSGDLYVWGVDVLEDPTTDLATQLEGWLARVVL